MKYRRKPTEVEAEQFLEGHPLPFRNRSAVGYSDGRWYVVTAHGQETPIVHGDWIIPEPDGRGFYPCKPHIFAATYEPVPSPPVPRDTPPRQTFEGWLTDFDPPPPRDFEPQEILCRHWEYRRRLYREGWDAAIAAVAASGQGTRLSDGNLNALAEKIRRV